MSWGGVWCRGFMSWGDTLICVISRGVQLFYGIAQCMFTKHTYSTVSLPLSSAILSEVCANTGAAARSAEECKHMM